LVLNLVWILWICYAASSGKFLLTFRDNLSGSFLKVQTLKGQMSVSKLEVGADRSSRNVGNNLPLLAAQ